MKDLVGILLILLVAELAIESGSSATNIEHLPQQTPSNSLIGSLIQPQNKEDPQNLPESNHYSRRKEEESYEVRDKNGTDHTSPTQMTFIELISNSSDINPRFSYRQRRAASDWLIAPNTRWCGRGNIANNTYNHLGGASAADRCCRKHDHCHAFIPAMSNRYNLFNYRPYTLTHCSCDRRFRTCLKMAGDLHANTIGQMFFNVMRSQCFILRRERLCRTRAADGSCSLHHIKYRAYVKDNKRY